MQTGLPLRPRILEKNTEHFKRESKMNRMELESLQVYNKRHRWIERDGGFGVWMDGL